MKTFATSVFKVEQILKFSFLWIVATTTKICTRDYLIKVQTLYFIILIYWKMNFNLNLHVILQMERYIKKLVLLLSIIRYKFLPLAPSIFETFSFGEWVVTHSLENTNFHGHLLAVLMKIYSLWDLEWGKNLAHLTGCSEQPASPVLLTRNGPLGAKCIYEW